jgi:hypothetical protein
VRAMPMAVCEFLAQHLPASAVKIPVEQ